tara:strand:+ start:461 stop:1495 length:1035 start_codon:yes stop_codon:yes gene_type:complete
MYKVVASFFDGFSGTMFALDKLGIEPDEYHAFEIDPYPTAVSKYNFPNIIRHGDARNWTKLKGKKIDLLVAGFPCQSYSIAGLRKYQEDDRDMSKVLIQALKELDVDKVLIENVASMPTEWRDYFTQTFKEIFPDISLYLEDSAKSSPQSRKRFYWTNIIYNDIKDEGMVLNDILEDGAMADRDKSHCLDANYFKGGNLEHYYKKSRRQVVFSTNRLDKCKQVGVADLKGYDIIKRVYDRQGKSPTLTTMQGGWRMPKVPTLGTMDSDKLGWRALTPLECERLQTVPDGCTRYGDFDDGKRENVFSFQTAEDIKPISNSQRYKMLGNGFCVSTIANILKGVDYD